MSYNATVVSVMIASPSDTTDARDEVERSIYSWNHANARPKGIILHPWRWETSSVPIMGGHPQQLINAQGVDDCDIVFALFGGRLGSPTPDAVSGTAEEITRATDMGKPVHVYFSNAPLPSDIDTAQLDALRTFKATMRDRGLLGEFNNLEQLNREVWKAIEHDIAALKPDRPTSAKSESSGVRFLVQLHQEREASGVNSKGAQRYRTRHWLDITNTGDRDAENVTFDNAEPNDAMHLIKPDNPTTIHRGQTRRVNAEFVFGGSAASVLRVCWTEGGEDQQREFHVR